MPEGPKCKERPADVIGNAMHVARIGTGVVEEGREPEVPAAASGRRGGAAPVEKPRPARRSERGPADGFKAVTEYL